MKPKKPTTTLGGRRRGRPSKGGPSKLIAFRVDSKAYRALRRLEAAAAGNDGALLLGNRSTVLRRLILEAAAKLPAAEDDK